MSFKAGQKVLDSPMGPGEITGTTMVGCPQVNGVAVAWFYTEEGPYGYRGVVPPPPSPFTWIRPATPAKLDYSSLVYEKDLCYYDGPLSSIVTIGEDRFFYHWLDSKGTVPGQIVERHLYVPVNSKNQGYPYPLRALIDGDISIRDYILHHSSTGSVFVMDVRGSEVLRCMSLSAKNIPVEYLPTPDAFFPKPEEAENVGRDPADQTVLPGDTQDPGNQETLPVVGPN